MGLVVQGIKNTLLSGRYGSPELIEFVRASLPQATSV